MLAHTKVAFMRPRAVRVLLALLLPMALGARPSPTHAAAIVVTRFDDPAPNSCQPGDCSLREAIIAANATNGRDTIVLAPGTYTLSIAGAGEDAAAAGDLDIAGDLTLTGAGAGLTTIDANRIDRALDIRSGNVPIAGITFAHGAAGPGNNGGGIRNAGTLALSASAVISSTAGVLFSFDGGAGGAVANTGVLQLTDSTISGNTSDSWGGGIFSTGSVSIVRSVLSGNTAGEASGGALETRGQATIRNSAITSNKTYGAGGGIGNSGTLELIGSQITNNLASEGQSAGGGIVNGGTLTVTGSLISHNAITSTYGGGLYNTGQATFIGSVIQANIAFDGPGGVYNEQGRLTLRGSAVDANTTTYGPGGIGNYAILTLLDSTISANGIANSQEMTATNSTFSAAEIENTGQMLFGNATITNAKVALTNSGTLELRNTILAGNQQDCAGPIVSLGHTLIGNVAGCTYTQAPGDLIGTGAQPIKPLLGPLQTNRGATATHAPLFGSPAIDAGDDATCPALDQRGVARPQGAACDIGAVEVEQSKWLYLPIIRVSLN